MPRDSLVSECVARGVEKLQGFAAWVQLAWETVVRLIQGFPAPALEPSTPALSRSRNGGVPGANKKADDRPPRGELSALEEGLGLWVDPFPQVPLAQAPQQNVKLLVRTATPPVAVISGIREAVREVDPNLPLAEVRTMEQVKEQSMRWARQLAWVIGAFATVAALLAALGLYGVLSQAVAQQRREIGIRMALGARQGDVLSHVLRGAFTMLVVGIAVGLVGAFALTRVLQGLLFQVSRLDPVALGVACLLMEAVGMLAAWIPAARAARLDPMAVLRNEG